LQADPFIQAPRNSQSFNRYSYVLNNPLSYTDPSGFISLNPFKAAKKLGRSSIRGASKVFGAGLVNYVGSAVATYYGGAWGAAAWSYEFTRAMGGSSSGALRGAFTAYIGSYVNANESLNGYQKFAINYGVGEIINSEHQQAKAAQIQTVGGTYSEITGGKFINGANSSAFKSMHPRLKQRALNKRIEVNSSGFWSNHVYTIRGQICSDVVNIIRTPQLSSFL